MSLLTYLEAYRKSAQAAADFAEGAYRIAAFTNDKVYFDILYARYVKNAERAEKLRARYEKIIKDEARNLKDLPQ